MQKTPLLATGLIILGLFLSAIPVQAANEHTYGDPTGDVMTLDINSGNGQVVTSSPYMTIADIDITNVNYSDDNAGTATTTLKVAGAIQNRGKIFDQNSTDYSDYLKMNSIEYTITIFTNESDYTITYINHTCQLVINGGDTTNITGYSVHDNTLTVPFSFTNPHEQYDSINATADFIKTNFSSLDDLNNMSESDFAKFYIQYEDNAPNPSLALDDVSAESNLVAIGKNVQFNCSVTLFSGLPPYTYHWSFGDGTSSTQQNPIHAYSSAGDYTYNCTVTDKVGTTVFEAGQIKIQGSSGTTTGSGNMVMIFIAIIVIIASAGVAIVVYLIRR